MKRVFLMAWAALALVGCSKHEQPVNGDSNLAVELSGSLIEAGTTRGAGVIEGTLPQSRTMQIDVFRADNTISYSSSGWDLNVAGFLTSVGTITLSPIQFWIGDDESKFIGVYPKGGTWNDGESTVAFPNLDGTDDVMVSDFAAGTKNAWTNSDNKLTFKHLLTKIRVELRAEGRDKDDVVQPDLTEAVINAWGKVTSIELVGKKTGAIVTLPTPDQTNADGVTIEADGGQTGNIVLTTVDGLAPAEDLIPSVAGVTYGYAMFLPTAAASPEQLSLKITVEDGREKTIITASPQEYEAGKGYTIKVLFFGKEASDVQIQLEGELTDWDEVDAPGDPEANLVESVTPQANTIVDDKMTNAYMIAPSSMLKFKVARAFNYEDNAFLTTLRATNAAPVNTEFTAEVLWQEPASGVIEGTPTVVGMGKNAVITVKTGGTVGNALIALKDGTTVVWSYHIWVTDYVPVKDDESTFTNPANNITFMDRNLGARDTGVSSVTTYGLYYQWGRKDPFRTETTVTPNTSGTTIEGSIMDPTTFYSKASDWLTTADNTLWNTSNHKSVYDPCPSGWKVPIGDADIANSAWQGMTEWTVENNTAYNAGSPWVYGGNIDPSSGAFNNRNSSGRWWSNMGTSGGGYNARHPISGSSLIGSMTKAVGQNIRCVNE